MNIYFSCSITGGRNDQEVYQAMVGAMLDAGHDIPTAHLSQANILALEAAISSEEVFQRDVAWVKGCDALVAEVSTPSHGVGYEIALAVQYHKPILCCYKAGKKVSKMILGNDSPGLTVLSYETTAQATAAVKAFLDGLA
jgi:2'-deoxynucleoside 5'-phosphate N-hydrolase